MLELKCRFALTSGSTGAAAGVSAGGSTYEGKKSIHESAVTIIKICTYDEMAESASH